MKALANIADIFPKVLFWDVNPALLDVQADKDLIIPRALFMTTEQTFAEDISKLENLYHKDEIVEELKNTKERISNKVCLMVAERYHVEKFLRFKF